MFDKARFWDQPVFNLFLNKIDCELSAWLNIVNGFILRFAFLGKVWFVVAQLAGLLVFIDFVVLLDATCPFQA